MKILVDADACPVIRQIEEIAGLFLVPVRLFADTSHTLSSQYAEVETVGKGAEAVDVALINCCEPGDIVVTQDYGVAAMALGKGAYAINQDGWQYTDYNIESLLMRRRPVLKKAKKLHRKHWKGCRKRLPMDDKRFEEEFENLLLRVLEESM